MAGIDVSKVLVGAPDQAVTGAISDAPVGTELPKDATSQMGGAFKSSGYVSDDGLELTTDRSTNDIHDWSGANIRKILKSFDSTLAWSEAQMSYESLCHAFGSENVTREPANAQHGERVTLRVNASLPAARSWVFSMKDGDARIRIVVPNGQVTSVDTIAFNSSDAITLPITLSCYPDVSGNSIYIYVDDGKVGVGA